MMEQLAERRMRREEDPHPQYPPHSNMHQRPYHPHAQPPVPDAPDEYDDSGEDDEDGYEDDDYEEDEDPEDVRFTCLISGLG